MTQLALTYDKDANGFECYLPDRTVHAPLAPSHPIDAVAVSPVGSQNGDMLRLAYSSRAEDGRRVIVIVHVDALTGQLVDAPSVSDTIDVDLADALLEAAGETANPAGALRDLLDFRADDESDSEGRSPVPVSGSDAP
ncbi:hypothetical protein [Subtercola sp. YIM 133946]|uniref:hypothetical protein n=1 Tax=Subtercola sp. YIM 133946 TaxID=3118909 RepID=UPI002F921B11